MSQNELQQLKKELVAAGVEIYRTSQHELQVAERVRLHIMDSGIRVRAGQTLSIAFTARSQRSDFPSVAPDQLFDKVRETVGRFALERGYAEELSNTTEVKDPMDEAKVLDTWHEVTYTKPAESLEAAVEEIRWALSLEKYVSP